MRPARASDLARIADIEAQCHPNPWPLAELTRELANMRVATDVNDDVVAYVVAWRVLDELQIQNVSTAPTHRRQGLARALLLALLREAPLARTATLEVRAGNEAALALYTALGFAVCGRRARYYSTGEDAILMTHHLT